MPAHALRCPRHLCDQEVFPGPVPQAARGTRQRPRFHLCQGVPRPGPLQRARERARPGAGQGRNGPRPARRAPRVRACAVRRRVRPPGCHAHPARPHPACAPAGPVAPPQCDVLHPQADHPTAGSRAVSGWHQRHTMVRRAAAHPALPQRARHRAPRHALAVLRGRAPLPRVRPRSRGSPVRGVRAHAGHEHGPDSCSGPRDRGSASCRRSHLPSLHGASGGGRGLHFRRLPRHVRAGSRHARARSALHGNARCRHRRRGRAQGGTGHPLQGLAFAHGLYWYHRQVIYESLGPQCFVRLDSSPSILVGVHCRRVLAGVLSSSPTSDHRASMRLHH
eukprot:m.190506 g.190506  ORF g.190506 m.190506 type:complete len:335 (+) comp10043_c0_seq1:2874-3878(+)